MSPRALDIKPSTRAAKDNPNAPKDPKKRWIEDTETESEAAPEAPVEKEPNKKLSLEIPESVHHAHKVGSASRKHTMVSEVIEMMAARNGLIPWPEDVVNQIVAQLEAEAAAADKARTARNRAKDPA
ncbi:hypothetical protein [Nocardia fluminea]|uniref:hypothetical protein n=1 Tax=Nocardia fluminea TaxID=134984 RepID=UPI003665EFED